MSDSAATITIYPFPKGLTNDFRTTTVRGTIALSQGHYPIGGYSLNWSAQEQIKTFPPAFPINVDVKSVANPPSGLVYQWDNVTGNLHIFVSNNGVSSNSGPLIELGAAAIPQWVFSDTIQFTAVFARDN